MTAEEGNIDERYRYEDVIGTAYRLGALFKPNQGSKPESKVFWHSRITRKNPVPGKWEKAVPYKKSSGTTNEKEARKILWAMAPLPLLLPSQGLPTQANRLKT